MRRGGSRAAVLAAVTSCGHSRKHGLRRAVNVNVYTFNPIADSRWPDFVRRHARSSVFHTRGWLDALQRTYGYRPVACTTSAPGERLDNAIVFSEVRSWLTGRNWSPCPFADHCEPLVDEPIDRAAIGAELERAVKARRWRSVELRPLTSRFGESGRAGQADSFCFHCLDLRPSLDDLFGRFHRDSIQRKIRRSAREGLEFDAGASEAHLQKFYGLLLLTRRRHRLPPQPIEWFRNLVSCMGARLQICLALKDGRAIAAVVLLRHEDTAVVHTAPPMRASTILVGCRSSSGTSFSTPGTMAPAGWIWGARISTTPG